MDFDNFIQETGDIQSTRQSEIEARKAKSDHYKEMSDIFKAIDSVVNTIDSIDIPTSIKTPDIRGVVLELKSLKDEIRKIDTIDKTTHSLLEKVAQAIKDIPEPKEVKIPEVKIPEFPKIPDYPTDIKVNNLDEIKLDTSSVEKAIKGLKLETKPIIKATTDIDALIPYLEALQQAIGSIQVNIPENDNKPVLRSLNALKKAITDLEFPVPNYVLPFSKGGKAVQVELNDDGTLPIESTIENAPKTFEYTGGKLTKMTKIVNGVTYEKTFTYVGNDLTAMSEWIEV